LLERRHECLLQRVRLTVVNRGRTREVAVTVMDIS